MTKRKKVDGYFEDQRKSFLRSIKIVYKIEENLKRRNETAFKTRFFLWETQVKQNLIDITSREFFTVH